MIPPRITLQGHTNWVTSAQFSPDGTKVVTASADHTSKIWNVETGQLIRTLAGHTGWVTSAQFSPDGTKVVTASEDSTAKIWDLKTPELIVGTYFNNPGRKLWEQSLLVNLYNAHQNGFMVTVQDFQERADGSLTVEATLKQLPQDLQDALIKLYDIRLF